MKSLILNKCPIDEYYSLNSKSRSQGHSIISNNTVEMFKNLPGIVTWKDINSVYLGCNERLAQLGNLKSPEDIIGKRVCDFPWGLHQYSDIFRKQDEEVLSGNMMYVLGKYAFFDKERLVLVKKMPLLNKSDCIVGTFNYITELHHENLSDLRLILNDFKIEITDELIKDVRSIFFNNTIRLSAREESCAYYLLRGFSAKQMAKDMGLSYRTVEFYMVRLRAKLNCSKISTLIVKLRELGY